MVGDWRQPQASHSEATTRRLCIAVRGRADGRLIATGGDDDVVRIWDVAAGRQLRALRGHDDHIVSVAFSSDGKLVASTGYDRSIRIWDVATGNHLQTLSGHVGAIKCLAFSPDGRQLASGSGSVGKGSRPGDPDSSELKIWDLNTGAASDLVGHTAKVGDLAWSPNGTLLASALMGGDGTVRIWDAASLNCIKTLRGTDEGLASLAFSPDGRHVAAFGFDSLVRTWDVHTGSQDRKFGVPHALGGQTFLAFGPKGRYLLASSAAEVRVWEMQEEKRVQSATGKRSTRGLLAGAKSPVQAAGTGGGADFWPDAAKTGGLLVSDSAGVLAFSPDRRLLAGAAGDRRTVKVWSAPRGEAATILRAHRTGGIQRAAFSPDSTLLSTAGFDEFTRVWDIQARREIFAFGGHGTPVACLSFSPDSKRVASGGWDRTAKVWERGPAGSSAPSVDFRGT